MNINMISLYFLTFLVFISSIQAQNSSSPPYTSTTTTTLCQPGGQHPLLSDPSSKGRPGKRGIAGIPGIKGEKGDPCQCDVADKIVVAKLKRNMQDLASGNREIKQQMADLSTENRGIQQQMAALTLENQQIKQEIRNRTISNNIEPEIDLSQPIPSTCVHYGINETITPWINEGNLQSVVVNCQLFSVDNAGWITIQKRQNGEVRFFDKNWETYARGFGNKDGEFWLGLRTIHQLTTTRDYKLRIEVGFKDNRGWGSYSEYSTFKVGSEKEKFQLTISGFSGDAGDWLDYHNGQYFSTYDVDNDRDSKNCAQTSYGDWWYKYCFNSNLNGKYDDNVFWWGNPLTSSEMKIHLI